MHAVDPIAIPACVHVHRVNALTFADYILFDQLGVQNRGRSQLGVQNRGRSLQVVARVSVYVTTSVHDMPGHSKGLYALTVHL